MRKEYAPSDVIGGKYSLLRLLGEGGMGSVWVAENMALKANVALKLIRADVAEASANERFLSEARLAARLQHAAIVRVFDFGKTEHDEPYIVMELLEGETLGQRLARRGAIDGVELCQTLLPIIDALHSAHGHGVIHRDLKPDNVFIAKADGGGVQPKLLDFGIAKLRGESAFHSTKLTQAGTLIGSPDYMSPEQARGETDLDPRSDVWALCVLAYECLVGKPPFHGDNYNALLWAIIHDEPVPVTVFQAGDTELWRILKAGFAKDRSVRWESARKLGEAFAAWLESHGVVEDVCNRSLHASWLPAERPTRPELAPFDPLAAGPAYRVAPQDASIPPTLTAIRRPHAMSLWFAGLGLLTLVGALLLNQADGGGIEVEFPGAQKVDALRPGPLPGPAPETRELPARDVLRPLPVPERAPASARELPIGALGGATSNPGSSWKENHERPAPAAQPALAEQVRGGLGAPAKDVVEPTVASKGSASKSAAPPRSKPKPASAATAPRQKPRPASKKPASDAVDGDSEVDFGI
ncbi:MAG TPA: protein kinase [Polyangiaceae bacterium]|nr:protein kinase [Polyangiaceae bacterium]